MPTKLSRRQIFGLPFVAPALSLMAAPQKKNVLFIAVDDLNTTLGCYGDPVTKSPNIDRLAARGIRFDNAYCNYPLCNPSRTSLLSGRRPETTKIYGNNMPPRTHLGNVVFLPEYFRGQGYFTARVGKIAHGLFEDAVKWDISENSKPGPNATRGGKPFAPGVAKKSGKNDLGEVDRDGGAPLAWLATGNKDEDEPDGNTARRIVQLMEQNKDKPWFLGCGFHKPHLPFVAPKKYFDMYPPDKMKVPYAPADDRADIPPIALTHGTGDENLTEADKRTAISAYHAATSFMDAQVGYVLDAVDRMKLWDNTVVILFGDHGWHLGEHLGLWRKMSLFEESARAPLMIVAPGKKKGTATPRLVEYVDIYPTLVELAGLPKPDGLEGASMVPLIDNPTREWKKAVFAWVARAKDTLGHTMRTDRYRYTEWGSDKVVELYDHQTDPKEFTNLAMNPKNAALVAEMRTMMRAGWQAYRPKV